MHRTLKDTRKTRKSYTLSPESVLFLENISRARRAASVSAVLDEMIQDVRLAQERHALDRAVTAYYGALPDQEASEQKEWGEFAFREFSREERA